MDTTTSPNYASSPKTVQKESGRKAPGILALALSAGVIVWLGAFGAELASAQTPQTAKVTYADLNIATPDGAHALLQRINVAAKDACTTETRHSRLFPRSDADFRQCVTDAVGSTVAKVNSPMLTAANGAQDTGIVIAAR